MIKDIIRKLRVNALHGIANIRAGSIEPKESLLIIAPHPDDEVIGCAGLIQRSLNKGNDVYVIILTGGEASHRKKRIGYKYKQKIGYTYKKSIFPRLPRWQNKL